MMDTTAESAAVHQNFFLGMNDIWRMEPKNVNVV